MSWLYSQALVAEYLGENFSDGEPSVQSSGNPIQLAYCAPDKMTVFSRPQPAAQFAGSYGTIDESAAKRIATALGWRPKREWIGLTQQDIDIAFDDTQEGGGFDDFARAIEQCLKRKNT